MRVRPLSGLGGGQSCPAILGAGCYPLRADYPSDSGTVNLLGQQGFGLGTLTQGSGIQG